MFAVDMGSPLNADELVTSYPRRKEGLLLFYLVFFAMFAALAIRAGLRPTDLSRRAMWVVVAILTIVIGLRDQVGGDWWNYLYLFDRIKDVSVGRAVALTEPGYALLNWIAARSGWGIWFPNVICAGIFSVGLVSLSKQQPNPALALAVAGYTIIIVGMGYTRQSAALGFVMMAMSQYTRGSTIRMAICLVFAVAFHTSALAMIPIMGLAVAKRGLGTTLMVALLGALLMYQFFSGILSNISVYTGSIYTASGAVPRLLINVLPALAFLSFPRQIASTDAELRLWTIFALLTLFSVALLFFLPSSVIADRLGIYLTPLQIVVLSRLPSVFRRESRANMFFLSGILVYSLLTQVVWLSFGSWSHAWLPYRNYLWESGTGKSPPRWFRRA